MNLLELIAGPVQKMHLWEIEKKLFLHGTKNKIEHSALASKINAAHICKCQETLLLQVNASIKPAIHFSYFVGMRNKPQNMKHSLHTFHISYELMLRKSKPRNPLTFHANADPGAKCCKMQKKARKTQKK